ncbi:hypothetical protein C8Q74DRAFT_1222277 [Fomes fomentarius]|nr:hypothetical protein C8Q74DRAFT_1222277 [Fomes fomentarius]
MRDGADKHEDFDVSNLGQCRGMYDRSLSDLVTFDHTIQCKTSTVSTAIYGVLQSAGGVLYCLWESDSLRTEVVNPEGRDHGKTKDEGENEKSIEPVKTVHESKRLQRRTGREEDMATADSTWVSMRFDHCQGACDRTEGCTGKEQESGSKDEGCDVDAMAERRQEVRVLIMIQGAVRKKVDDDASGECGMVVGQEHRGHRSSRGGVQREERESASCCTLRRPGREARVETCILAMFSTSAANLRGCADCAPASYAPFGLPPQVVWEVSTDARSVFTTPIPFFPPRLSSTEPEERKGEAIRKKWAGGEGMEGGLDLQQQLQGREWGRRRQDRRIIGP